MRTFDAVVDALLPEWPRLPPECRAAVSASCSRFVAKQIALSPAHIRSGIRMLLAVFYAYAFFRLGLRPLTAVSRQSCADALRALAFEGGAPMVALERVLRSMTVLAYFDSQEVQAAISNFASPEDAL
jgi:hypothetical protein